ncbi:TetR/AcrR family transcriptional regulator [Lactobacillus sp. ESL0677]|uniref:TetR/AcrR family transcriptional regulator n=1 Tax=Lactobacillus sp. ESL0677 TaxID=2983208 RepID=UPI0023F79EC1|nr:TetR/AcrR family transcriptional regulator [Lactobacillus sp. ESL0677]WEV37336.1 TetR/AcrR family transcriptional regulator [Lactobacillus sp. ESL0677]
MKKTEEQLVERAIQVIDQEGFQNLSLRKLTAALGLTTGAFYKHFTSKNDLFNQATIKLSQDFIAQIDFHNDKPEAQLLQIADYFVNQVQEHPNTMEFLFFNENATAAFKNTANEFPFLVKMRQLTDQITQNNSTTSDDFFIQIWSFIQGYALLIKNGITNYNKQLVQLTLIQMIKGDE